MCIYAVYICTYMYTLYIYVYTVYIYCMYMYILYIYIPREYMRRCTVYTPFVYIYICAYVYRKPRPPSPSCRRARQARPDSGTPRGPGQPSSAPRPRSPCTQGQSPRRAGASRRHPPSPSRANGRLKATRAGSQEGRGAMRGGPWRAADCWVLEEGSCSVGLASVLTDGV